MKLNMKKYSVFQIVCVVLIAILVIAIIVQIGILIHLKLKTNDLEDKNDKLPTIPVEEESFTTWEISYMKAIEKAER